MKKRNFIAKDLLTKKYSQKKVKPKKGKGSFKRKKLKSRTNLLNNF
tara:strand:- start:15 stop:152 length:138 start_codon:yes stop_codon:yes gene_type:complete